MFEVKRKPNSQGARGKAASTITRVFPDSREGAQSAEPAPPSRGVPPMPPGARSKTSPSFIATPVTDAKDHQTKLPVITGEAQYKGVLHLDGVASGQLGGCGGTLTVRQRSRSYFSEPEFSGEVTFRDLIRVNGHIAGKIHSKTGTLIVDVSATVNANIDVGIAVIGGTVRGDIFAHQRVEIGPKARIYGNIRTRSIEIKDGAIFEGFCTMIGREQIAG